MRPKEFVLEKRDTKANIRAYKDEIKSINKMNRLFKKNKLSIVRLEKVKDISVEDKRDKCQKMIDQYET
jgi:hypothetical protein